MPKPKYSITSFLKKGLLWKIENFIGYRILTKLDCKKLSAVIEEKGLPSISESTLYRLFLWGENTNSPYIHTLDTLAKFIEFENWFVLEEHLLEIAKFQMTYGKYHSDKTQIKSLLNICIHKDELRPLYDYLEQFPTDIELLQKHILGDELFFSLKSNPNKNQNFFKNFSKIPIVREGLFEYLADPTFSIPQYEIGINHYLENILPHNSTSELQDFIFGNCLLLRYYFTKNDFDSFKKIGHELYVKYDFPLTELNKIHLFPTVRYLSYKMMFIFKENLKEKIETYLEWLIDFAVEKVRKNDIQEQRIVIHTISDALQFDLSLQEKTFLQLKILLPEPFIFFPDYINKINTTEALKFLDANAATVWDGKRF
jgi:hypothetical protein